MSNVYSNHKEQLDRALPSPERQTALVDAMQSAFAQYLVQREVAFIQFDSMSVDDLAEAFCKYPIIVKSVLASVNVASRAIARDLGVDLDTYATSLDLQRAATLAGYLKPLLPRELALPALIELDRYFWTDKQMRAHKGAWEKAVVHALNTYGCIRFKKIKFHSSSNKEEFELDASAVNTAGTMIGVDIKRIESPRDIHKRSDEILNKAVNFKATYPEGLFFVIVYYPFPSEHDNVKSRLSGGYIDAVFFAGETEYSVNQAASYLLARADSLKTEQD